MDPVNHSMLGPSDLAAGHTIAIQTLTERWHLPFEVVKTMYCHELAQLASHARIRQYLPLLASRRVRDLLRHARAGDSGCCGTNGQ